MNLLTFSSIFYKCIGLTAIFATFFISGNKVKNELSSREIIYSYSEQLFEKMDRCSKINLTVPLISNFEKKTILVLFSLSDSKFRDCFTYFKISLKNRTVDNSSMVPFDYGINKVVSYTFQNVGCGVYELNILPCYNNWQCQQPPFAIKKINMSSADCLGIQPRSHRRKIHTQEFEKKVLLIVAVVAITLLIIIGLSYYKLAMLKSKKEKKLCIENGIEMFRNHEPIARGVQVFIINHYNNATIRGVELLRDFMLNCPNLNIVLIGDGLAVSLITGSDWLDSMLRRTDTNDAVIKKIIVVDSIEQMEAEENEIENNIFYEAIKKLSHDWSRSLDDYDNLFVVHFNCSLNEQGNFSPSRLQEMDYIVKRVRYCIPDQLIILCMNLISGTQCDTHDIEERLRNVLSNHDIRNLGVV